MKKIFFVTAATLIIAVSYAQYSVDVLNSLENRVFLFHILTKARYKEEIYNSFMTVVLIIPELGVKLVITGR